MPSCHRSGVNIAIPIGANAVVPIHKCYSHCTMLTCCHCCGVNVIITVYNCCCCYSQRLPTLSECYHCAYFVQLNFAIVILICLMAAVCNVVLMCINVVVAMCNIDVTKCLQCFGNGYTNNTASPWQVLVHPATPTMLPLLQQVLGHPGCHHKIKTKAASCTVFILIR